MITETGNVVAADLSPAVSWRAILAGTTVTIALTFVLIAFGIGVGFSVVSPWSDSGISGTTFSLAGGIYLIVVAMLSSTIGGYIAGRLRAPWATVHAHERYFRDTAHGVVVWALATIVGAAILSGAATRLISGAAGLAAPAAGAAAAQSSPSDVYVDDLLRTDPAAAGTANAAPMNNSARGEVGRILAPALRKGGNVSADARTYLGKVVAARTGLPQADADQRVNQVITQAQSAADTARRSAAKFALWLVASMLAGALAAALGAAEGGSLRNSDWYLRSR